MSKHVGRKRKKGGGGEGKMGGGVYRLGACEFGGFGALGWEYLDRLLVRYR